MTLDYARLVDSLVSSLTQELSSRGFTFDSACMCFARRSNGFMQLFQVPFVEKYEQAICVPQVGVRSDRVEQVFHRTSEYSGSDAERTATLGVNI